MLSFLSKLRFRSKDPWNVSNRDIQILRIVFEIGYLVRHKAVIFVE